MPMMPKADAGFTEPSLVVSLLDTSTPSVLAMVGDHSSSSLPGAARQTASLNNQKILWMRKIQVSLGLLRKEFELPAITLIMDRRERRGRG